MSMVTVTPSAPVDREAIKEEIRAELRHEARRKRLFGCFGCIALAFLTVAVPVVIAAAMVAKTGLVDVPFFSAKFYAPTAPIRTVRPLAGSTTEQILKTAIAGAKFDPATGTAAISVSEEQLTSVIRDVLGKDDVKLPLELKEPQIAVQPDMIELFAVTPRDGKDVPVRLRLSPTVTSEGVRIEVKELVLGGFEAPAFMTKLMTTAMDRVFADAIGSFAGGGAVTDVGLSAGKLKVTVIVPDGQ